MRNISSNKSAKLLASAAVVLFAMSAQANIEWIGGGSGYWDDSTKWSGTVEPHRFNYATMKGAAATVTFRNAETLADGLWIENSIEGKVTFTADSLEKGLTQTSSYNLNLGTGTYGALAINGGKYHFANDILVGIGNWNDNARGDFNLISGRVETHYWMVLGIGSKANAQGNVTVSGGELVVGCRTNEVGVYAAADNGRIEMGRAAGSVTTFMQTGGAVSSQFENGPALIVGSADNTTATYTISNGTYTARAGNVLIANGAGSTGTLNICGGTFSAEAIANGSGTATVNLDGGRLAAKTDGTLIASGVALKVGATESTIELSGQTVTIDGNVAGVYGTDQTTGALKVSGWGKLIVTGDVKLDTLTVAPSEYHTGGSDYTLTLDAKSIFVRHLYGSGNITTRSGINTGDGAFYGKISGTGGFRTRGATTLYGLHDFAGSVTFADSASLSLVSSLDGISPLWRVDASDANSITTNAEGKVTAWASQTSLGSFSNDSSAMVTTTAHFGGKTAVLTGGGRLTSSWTDDGSPSAGHHTDSTIGAVCVESHGGGGAILLQYDGVNNRYVGRRASTSAWDYWTRMTGSSQSTTDGIWQNSVYTDTTYHSDERIIAISGFERQSSVKSISIGGGAGSVAIGEYMGFTYNISSAQRKQIETYLANKWNVSGMGKSLPQVDVITATGATLDLGGLDVTVSRFTGSGVVKNGTLETADGKYTQGDGDLTIPAVDGAVYYASSGNSKLVITGASGKNVTIVVPDARVEYLDGYVFCEGDGVTFKNTSGETLDMSGYRHANGWWTAGDYIWTGDSAEETKYWDDMANWTGYDLTDAETYWRIDKAADIWFRGSVGPASTLLVDGGPVTFYATDDAYGYTEPGAWKPAWFAVGAHKSGELVIANGTHQFTPDIHVGRAVYGADVTGTFTIQSGSARSAYWTALGEAGGGKRATGIMNIEGGELAVGYRDGAAQNADSRLNVGVDAGCTGIVNQSGGTVSSSADGNGNAGEYAMMVGCGEWSTGVYNLSGGSYTARAGKVKLADGANSSGTLNIDGGWFTAAAIEKGAGQAAVNLNGGTLVATADGTFIAGGIAFSIGDNGGCINPNGHNIIIEGDVSGSGSLTVTGFGTVTVNGSVNLPNGELSFAPNEYYSGAAGETHNINFNATSINAATLSGIATISTTGGVTAGRGAFYGKIAGAGGLTVTGETSLYGLSDFSGRLAIGRNGILYVVSSLDGIPQLWRVDASAADSLTLSDGKVVNWVSQTGNGSFANADSPMTVSYDYFGGKPSVVTRQGALTSSWDNDGSAWKIYHTDSIIGSVHVIDHSNQYELLLKYNGLNSAYIGKRSSASTLWTKMRGSGNNDENGFWQNGVYGDREFHTDDRVLSIFGYGRLSSATSLNIGGWCGSVAIGELMGFNYNPSQAQRKQIETYLANKWNITAMGRSIPNVPVSMSGGTLDLGGLDATVQSFSGSGTVKNGTLRTANNLFTQRGGKLSIPGVDKATYVASISTEKLEITGAAGKTVTVRIPANWLDPDSKTYSYIYCDGTVNFAFDGEPLQYTQLPDGRYRFGTVVDDIDYGEYGENTTDDANEDNYTDEAGTAFPGAFGWGRFAVGARASNSPSIYHVTNLKDSGAGSLRDAVSKPNRIIVFDVSGVIKISSRITFSSNLYVAGQTAPGEGVTVYGNGCSFSGASNIICRHLRWRMGHIGTSGKDCAGIANGANMIFDHCSFSWGLDETFSINPDGKGTYPHNITLQNCIFGQGLMTHSAGGLMQADYVTLFRNLYVDNSTRNNKVKGINQYANNIVYNWKNGCYIMGGDSSGSSYCTIESSLFINGPVSGDSNALGGGNSEFHFYGNDNWQDKNRNGILDGGLVSHNGGGHWVEKSVIEAKVGALPALPLYAGNTLLENNLRKVGASLPYRDQSDCYMIDDVKSIGRSGGLITYEDALAIGAPDTWDWWSGTKRTDTDNDGIPDEWEDAHGLNKNNYSDALAKASNGRLNIENYINSITADDSQPFLRAPITLRASATTTHRVTLAWRDYTYGEIGFSVEMLENGAWVQKGIAGPNATSYTVGNLTQGTYYDFRVIAVGRNGNSALYSEPAYLYGVNTRQEETGEVDIDNYEPDYTLKAGQQYWDNSHRYWVENLIYSDGSGDSKVLLNTDGSEGLTITSSVAPESIVANGTGYVALNRVGNIGGAASINKGNTGTLALSAGNKSSLATYTGKVVNHGGTIEFDSIANGGAASSLGKSTKDALNWIFDGGTYKYTGGTASTDRSATFRKTSVLNIANSGTELTMTGAMEGTGDFILDGAGTLNIPDANTFFGNNTRNAIVRGGTLFLSTTGDSGSARNFANKNTVKSLTLAGGHVKFQSRNEEYQTYNIPIYAEDGTSSALTLATHSYMKSRITGNGDITFNIQYVRTPISSNLSDFTGNITANGVPAVSGTRPSFYHASYWNYPKTRFTLTGQISMASKSRHVHCHLGGLSGTAGTTLSGSDTKSAGSGTEWNIGYANSDETFEGVIDDYNADRIAKGTTSIVKVGTGYWRLTGDSTFTGYTKVNAGSLIVNGKLAATSAVTVNDGATLQGKGDIQGFVTVASGGTLRAGDTIKSADVSMEDSGNLITRSGLKLESGSRVVIPVARATTGGLVKMLLSPRSSITIEDGVTLELDLSEVDALNEGEYISIFATTLPTRSGEFSSIEPAKPGKGLKWDTSRLYDGRYIKVVKDPDYVPDMNPAEGDTTATVQAVSELDAYNAIDIVVPPDAASAVDAETYKSYFKYTYTDNGNGSFDVAIAGIADDIAGSVLDSTIDALRNQTRGDDGCVQIAVVPGLYYCTAGSETPDIGASSKRALAWGSGWRAPKQTGGKHYVRIDISPGATDATGMTSATAAVVFVGAGESFAAADATPQNGILLKGTVVQERGSILPITLSRSGTALSVSPRLADNAAFAFEFDAASSLKVACAGETVLADGDSISLAGLMTSAAGSTPLLSPAAPGEGLLWDASRLLDGKLVTVVTDPDYNPLPFAVAVEAPVSGYSLEQAETIAATASIAPPSNHDGLTAAEIAQYENSFVLVKHLDGDGTYSVSAEVKPDGTNILNAAMTYAIRNDLSPNLALIAESGATLPVKAVPGFYYSVFSGPDLKTMSEGERKQAGTGGTIELLFPKHPGQGFYKILVNTQKKKE